MGPLKEEGLFVSKLKLDVLFGFQMHFIGMRM